MQRKYDEEDQAEKEIREMRDEEIKKFREVLGIEEEIKVPEGEVEDAFSVKTTAFYSKPEPKTAATPKSQQKITRKTI